MTVASNCQVPMSKVKGVWEIQYVFLYGFESEKYSKHTCLEAQAIVQTNVHYVSSHSIFLKVIHRNSKDFIKG